MKKFLLSLLITGLISCQDKEVYKPRSDWEMNSIFGPVKVMTKHLYDAHIDSASGKLMRGELLTIYTFTFNEKGYLLNFREYHPKEDYHQGYDYDGKGYMTSFYRLELGDTLRDSCVFIKNEKGWMMEEIWYEHGKTLQARFINTHDKQGNIIATDAYTPDKEGVQRRQEYVYDERGNRKEIKYFDSQNALVQRIEHSYDDNDQLNSRRVFRLFGENWINRKDEHKYQDYDEHNNWLRQISTYNVGDPGNMHYKWTERTFEYFKED